MAFTNIGLAGSEPRKRTPPPPPFGKKPDMAVVIGVGPKKPMGEAPIDHEASETPDMEASEEYGAKLAQDIEAAGASVGLDPAQARKAAGAFFAAVAKCLGAEGDDEPDPGDMGDGTGGYEQ